jgi:hypothetical protein
MMDGLGESERREIARRFLDTAEAWLRKIIDHKLTFEFGEEYFNALSRAGEPVIPKAIREQAVGRMQQDATRFARPVDAITFGDAVKIVLRQELYDSLFKAALQAAYPDGKVEALTFLRRLEAHRNKLAHGGNCSVRDLEQVVCYSNDLVESLKDHFVMTNEERLFNVPMITRVVDSKGNELRPPATGREHISLRLHTNGRGDLRVGETLSIEVEIDESFARDSYYVRWKVRGVLVDGYRLNFLVGLEHVGVSLPVECEVVSKQDWHRLLGGIDDRLIVLYRVLPP